MKVAWQLGSRSPATGTTAQAIWPTPSMLAEDMSGSGKYSASWILDAGRSKNYQQVSKTSGHVRHYCPLRGQSNLS
jgi:hypothetical protein